MNPRAQERSSKGEKSVSFLTGCVSSGIQLVAKARPRYSTGAINYSGLSVSCDEFGSSECQAGNLGRNLWQSWRSVIFFRSTVTGPFLGWM